MSGRILIVDDNALVRQTIKAALLKGSPFEEFQEAGDGLAAFKLLMARPPDLVLCDLIMPGFDGLKLLALKASRPELAQIPIIMLTSESDGDRKAEILERGASDYLTKPFHEKELLARVRIHHKLKKLQDELRETNARLETLAITDALTGLFNRRELMRRLGDELARAQRFVQPLSVLMIDVDHFKQVNDTWGHAMGDAVLQRLGHMLTAKLRRTDVAARYGGEEFTVLLPNTDSPDAFRVADGLRGEFSGMVHRQGDKELRRTLSIGVATELPARLLRSVEELLRTADEALYRAKAGGRNRVC
jgi:two-component system, cell cycle response regulator